MTGELVTFLTGHGKLKSYLYRYKTADILICPYGRYGNDTVDHLIFQCKSKKKEITTYENIIQRIL